MLVVCRHRYVGSSHIVCSDLHMHIVQTTFSYASIVSVLGASCRRCTYGLFFAGLSLVRAKAVDPPFDLSSFDDHNAAELVQRWFEARMRFEFSGRAPAKIERLHIF